MRSTSRIAPSTTMPPSRAAAAVWHISSPKTALVVFPPVLTTTMSPGVATWSALWTIRLSAGRALTVTARPHNGSAERAWMAGSMKLKRPMASARFDDARPRKPSTSSAGRRGGDGENPKSRSSEGMCDCVGAGERLPISRRYRPATALAMRVRQKHGNADTANDSTNSRGPRKQLFNSRSSSQIRAIRVSRLFVGLSSVHYVLESRRTHATLGRIRQP